MLLLEIPSLTWSEELWRVVVAAGLGGAVGLERELREREAGFRTHLLVSVGSCLFTLVSAYGFREFGGSSVDPTRIAAQIVTGVGFLGAGAIIRQGFSVRGLTTAATLWMTAAIGMACGAGLALVALVATGGHLLVVLGYPRLLAALPRSRHVGFGLRVVYQDGRGILRDVLAESTRRGFRIAQVATQQLEHDVRGISVVAVTLELIGQPSAEPLAVALADLDGVLEVATVDHAHNGD